MDTNRRVEKSDCLIRIRLLRPSVMAHKMSENQVTDLPGMPMSPCGPWLRPSPGDF